LSFKAKDFTLKAKAKDSKFALEDISRPRTKAKDNNTGLKVKVKLRRVELLMILHLTATECHLSYGITQCYLFPYTSEHTPP